MGKAAEQTKKIAGRTGKGAKKVERKKTIVTTAKAKKQKQQQHYEPPHRPSKYVGVSWNKKNKKWIAQITIDGKRKNLGLYHDEKEAARIYDEQAALLGKPVNFPLHEGMEQAVKRAYKRKDVSKVPNVNRPSKYVGVTWSKQDKKWKAAIRIDGKSKTLGYYHDEKEAARIYDEQAALLGKPVNFPLHEGMEQAVKQVPKGTAKRYKKVRRGKDDKAADDKAKEEDDDEGLSGMEEGTNDDDDDSRWC